MMNQENKCFINLDSKTKNYLDIKDSFDHLGWQTICVCIISMDYEKMMNCSFFAKTYVDIYEEENLYFMEMESKFDMHLDVSFSTRKTY